MTGALLESTRWVDSEAGLLQLLDDLEPEPAYAIDTEFLRERTYYPQLALVQIGWPGGIALIDPLKVDIHPLKALLDSDKLAVLHAADQDLEILETACGVVPRRLFDTQIAGGFVGFATPSLATLCERVLKVSISKGDRLTDWTKRPLTEAQRRYAASDVAYLLVLRDLLCTKLAESGRLGWVDEECELMRSRVRNTVSPSRAWWRLKEGRVLRGNDRLVAQELCAWRERRAQRDDRPPRFVLPDMAVITIAQAKPRTVEALRELRGIDGRAAKGSLAKELLDTVETALSLDRSALELPETDEFDKRLKPAVALITAWVAQLARDKLIDTPLLATRSDLIAFLRGDSDARLGQGWRAEVVGTAVRQLSSGEAALVFLDDGNLALERRSFDSIAPDLAVPKVTWVDTSPDTELALD